MRIEGRILDHPKYPKMPGCEYPKFSSFFKSAIIELERDLALYPDGNVVEWIKTTGLADTDGFEVKKSGTAANVPVKIYLNLDYAPEKFKLSEELSQLLGIHTDTKAHVIMALWQYIKIHKLQDADDKKIINNNDSLQKVLY